MRSAYNSYYYPTFQQIVTINDTQLATTQLTYRPDIDGLRALAIGCVLIFHAFPQHLAGGFVGVDIFFVISGFLISTILLKSLNAGLFSLWHFYARRIRRLFPVLLVVLLVNLALGCWLLAPLDYKELAKYTAGGAAFMANLVFAADNGPFNDLNDTNPLLHLWSLGIEEQFYLLWPLILWFFYWRRWPFFLPIGLGLVMSFTYSVHLSHSNLKLAFHLPFSRFWELLAGAVLAWWTLQPWSVQLGSTTLRRTLAQVASVAGVICFILSLYILSPNSVFPGWWAWLPVLSAWCFIAAGPSALINKYVLSHPIMVWFGLISYPLYLWHWPLLAYFHGIPHTLPSQWYTPTKVGLLALSVFLAWLSYKYIEIPLRGSRYSCPKLVGLIAAMSVVTLISVVIWQT